MRRCPSTSRRASRLFLTHANLNRILSAMSTAAGVQHRPGRAGRPAFHRRPFCGTAEIRKSFGGVHAVNGVNFTVRAGEIHALVGENGAGKSTLVKMLSGMIEPDGGSGFLRRTASSSRIPPGKLRRLASRPSIRSSNSRSRSRSRRTSFSAACRAGMVSSTSEALRQRTRETLRLLGADLDPAIARRQASRSATGNWSRSPAPWCGNSGS